MSNIDTQGAPPDRRFVKVDFLSILLDTFLQLIPRIKIFFHTSAYAPRDKSQIKHTGIEKTPQLLKKPQK